MCKRTGYLQIDLDGDVMHILKSVVYFFSRVDVCDSTVEVTTPYWATNSKGKVRAIVNNKQFEQAVHQEICG